MPITLWRHLLIELAKTLLITTAIIVTVIAFGAAAKPLAENALGADMVAKYVAFATIPMLQYALPFAAGFAATVVLHRFVSDNEITAMSASGMSYGRILAPVAILGAILGVIMFVLVAFVVPRFWARMMAMTTADATQLLVAAVQRGEAVQAGNLLIYADSVEEVAAPPDTGAKRRLFLRGLAAIELGPSRTGPPTTEFTAETAVVDVHARDDGTVAKMALVSATVFRPADGAIANVPFAEPEAISFDRGFYRGPKYLPLGELLELRNDVDRATIVQEVKREMAGLLSEVDMWSCALESIDRTNSVTLGQRASRRTFTLQGAALDAGTVVPAQRGGVIVVTELIDGKPVRRTETTKAVLNSVSEVGFNPAFSLAVGDPQKTRDLVENAPARWPPRLDDLDPLGCNAKNWTLAPSSEVMQAATGIRQAETRVPFKRLADAAASVRVRLQRARDFVRWESDSHLVHRASEVVSVGLVLLLGAVLAASLRRALPLTVYILAFLPAIGNILLIAGGQQTMRDGHLVMGVALMCGGNLLLGIVLLWTWNKLVRN